MSSVPDNEGPRPPAPPPLGRLLVERELLTEEQLTAGLAEQAKSGRPLGEVIVGLGFVPPWVVAQALATQHGGLLKSEYGFATGFADHVEPVVGPSPDEPAESSGTSDDTPDEPLAHGLRLVPASNDEPESGAEAEQNDETERRDEPEPDPSETAAAHVPDPGAAMAAELAAALERAEIMAAERDLAQAAHAAEAMRAEEVRAELDETRAEIAALRAWTADLETERDAIRADLGRTTDAYAAAIVDVETGAARITALERDLGAARAEFDAEQLAVLQGRLDEAGAQLAIVERARDHLSVSARQLEDAVVERDRTIDELRAAQERLHERALRCEELEQELAALRVEPATEAPAPEAADSHFLFMSVHGRYELYEAAGPAPAVGSVVPVPGSVSPQLVVRVGRAPLPRSELDCAYLQPV